MPFSLTWLPDVLLKEGLKVSMVDGWEFRGLGDMGEVRGVICHHTATVGLKDKNMPTLKTLIDGRSDLRGPLAQLGLGRDGTYYVVAPGRCQHAGQGAWHGETLGNTHFIGIEAENSGLPTDSWPTIQMQAYQHGVAAILRQLKRDESWCAGHKEWALPHGRKNDPLFDMVGFRKVVSAILTGGSSAPVLTPIPPAEPAGGTARPTLRRPDENDAVKLLQAKLKLNPDGKFTEAAVRAFQRTAGLVPDGIVGPKSWAALDKLA
jgi:peptidoglycan hydrolase-like protein with peptidoglycan-binding domain